MVIFTAREKQARVQLCCASASATTLCCSFVANHSGLCCHTVHWAANQEERVGTGVCLQNSAKLYVLYSVQGMPTKRIENTGVPDPDAHTACPVGPPGQRGELASQQSRAGLGTDRDFIPGASGSTLE